MKKVIRLTESDLLNIVKRIISEQETQQESQPSDNNFIQQKYTEFTNLLTPAVRDAFIKQYPVQDAVSELNSCKPSKFENFKTKLTGLKDKLKSFVSGSDLNKDIQSVSSYLEKTPNVNEQTGVVILSGLAMLLLTSIFKNFLYYHGYVPATSCMRTGLVQNYMEGIGNFINDLLHFKVKPVYGSGAAKIQKWDPKKFTKGVENTSAREERQQQRQFKRDVAQQQREQDPEYQAKMAQQDAITKQRANNREQKEYYTNLIKSFEGYVKQNYNVGNVSGYLKNSPEDFDGIFAEFTRNTPYSDDSSKTVSNYIKKYYKLV
jgi:hypothetical protein